VALRVVAGELGGRRLTAPADVRPTTERVREALFSSLGGRVEGAAVLDLFAGSGAMALEALSRGAERAVLVDLGRAAAAACRANVEALGLAARARVVERAASVVVGAAPPGEAPFDLVFCDPPYETPGEEVAALLVALAAPGWLSADAAVVVERSSGEDGAVPWPDAWTVGWERRYGDTLVSVVTLVE
jgi:16S rRNA (guanine966-N2)-methyltransferase